MSSIPAYIPGPILVFSYGGVFYMHAQTFPAPASIIYHNLCPFATRGFITGYHLVDSRVRFPGTALDERDAMQWVVNDLAFSESHVYTLGRSVVAMNMFTILALPGLFVPDLHPRIEGASSSLPYTVEDIPTDMQDSVRLYYGEDAEVAQTVSLLALESARSSALRLLLGTGERDIPRLHPTTEKFSEFLRAGAVAGA
ncbi:hypothetical protein EV421DRAFT_601084 [Armillaria borealis]|uniref:Alpha/beta-hydrolase n=1 Tax=Armillaria borealis TaxID=47425 RepID=A0AA39JGX8_9AGAR|nr:hypothetical protein EV421DRAFT_601084 [Armillaria borealis]